MFSFQKNTQPLMDEVNKKLFSRLDCIQLQPQTILFLDCSTQKTAYKLLKKRFPKAHIIEHKACLASSILKLPYSDNSIDVIYANLVIPFAHPLPEALKELRRVLKPHGLLLFSSLGPDTFKEWRNAWANIGIDPETYGFQDILDIGNHLTASGFTDPVLDVDRLQIQYKELDKQIKELKQHGLHFYGQHWPYGLITPHKFKKLKEYLSLSVSLELVFGHAWKPEPKQERIGNEIYIPVQTLLKKKE